MIARPLPPPLDFVAGELTRTDAHASRFLVSPNDGARIEALATSTPDSLERALSAAAEAHDTGTWRALTAGDRAAALERIASELEARAEPMAYADAATTGVPITLTRSLAALVPHVFRAAAQELRGGVLELDLPGAYGTVEVRRRPWGTAAIIAPWNAPAVIAAHKLASALAAGCPVVLKPSEWAPHSCRAIADAVRAAGLPRNVFHLVHGDGAVGAQVVADPRVKAVSFTGGLHAGRAVARACADALKPVQLELGGNNPMVVFADADVERASAGVVTALTTLNGQWCRALGRLIVHASMREALMARVLERLASLKLGDSRSESTEMGPLIHRAHVEAITATIASRVARGAVAHASTPLPDAARLSGTFVAPTLLTGCADADAVDEIFGPVATVHTFDTDAEAQRLVAASPFGLAGYVFGGDTRRALAFAREMPVGSVKVNGVSLLSLHPAAPRPAWGLSGLVDEGTRATLLFFTGSRVVGLAGGAS